MTPFEYVRAVNQTDVSPAARHVMLVLLAWLDLERGRCFPSVASIAAAIGKSERAVRRIMDELEVAQLVMRKGKSCPGRARVTWVNVRLLSSIIADERRTLATSEQRTPASAIRRNGASAVHPQRRTLVSATADAGVHERRTLVSAQLPLKEP